MVPLTYAQTMREIEELVATIVPPGHMITHLDVVVATRSIDNPRNGGFQRFPAPGADPLMSMGVMLATLDELRVRLNPNLDVGRR